jgi:hypothetical protein
MAPKLENSSSVQLPPFWPSDVQNWFTIAEYRFRISNITCEDIKFLHVASSLPLEFVQQYNDIIVNPPEENPYSTLKKTLIERNTLSEEARIHQLMRCEELGDRQPSEMLRSMQRLIDGRAFDKVMLRSLFLQKLPKSIQEILAPMEKTTELSVLADSADRIHRIQSAPAVNAITASPSRPRERDEELYGMVQNLSRMVQTLQLNQGRRLRSPSPRRSLSRDRYRHVSRSNSPESDLCWYHERFGAQATKCRSPCNFYKISGNEMARQ